MKLNLHIPALVTSLVLSLNASATITVSGGSGSPLSLSFSSPPTFTMTSFIDHETNGNQLYLVVPGIMSATENTFSGSPTVDDVQWSNDGAGGGNSTDNSTISLTTYDFVLNDIATTDLWIWLGTSGQSEVGDTITFTSVNLTSALPFSSVIPDGISVDLFLTDESGNLASNSVSDTISVVPEPSALAFGGLALMVAAIKRRR
ncbi:PEP-CTERM sorting domain-containing protein [Haloferula sp.]|uniref:PEP-CTERM sorting domain-containing protein n=1 Tax=Haloferula sp. TaxID=2497595 RepID=UPI00329DFB86